MAAWYAQEAASFSDATELEDWGFRAGAGEGECAISGIFLSKDADVKTGIWECTPGGKHVVERVQPSVRRLVTNCRAQRLMRVGSAGFDVPDRTNTETVLILKGKAPSTTLFPAP